jgi:hypothetical protein
VLLKCLPVDCDKIETAWFLKQKVQLMKQLTEKELSFDREEHMRIMQMFEGFEKMIEELRKNNERRK